jgi:hypothetical protein
MTTSASKIITRADIALADFAANGGLLLPEQANQFIDFIYDEPTILRQSRFIRMTGPQKKINGLRLSHPACRSPNWRRPGRGW